MHKIFKPLFVAGAIGAAAMFAGPASAQDAGSLLTQLKQSGAETSYAQRRGVRGGGFRGGRRGFGRGGFNRGGFNRGRIGRRGFGGRGFRGRGFRRGGIGAGAVLGGLAAGALVGGALAAQGPVYAAPGGDPVAYCLQRFRSYDPASGTYLGYDGLRHPCP